MAMEEVSGLPFLLSSQRRPPATRRPAPRTNKRRFSGSTSATGAGSRAPVGVMLVNARMRTLAIVVPWKVAWPAQGPGAEGAGTVDSARK